jgi:lipopolysaccharide/colanic/teichoic acid biosynthesis glycosyltransferase
MRNNQIRKGSKSKAFLRDASKRIFDIAVSSVAILISAPILGFAALLVKVNSTGPVFYRGIRVGRHGKPFRILKFRTMVVGAELRGGSATAADDPRITHIGKFLRHYKLDELPQFFNVLVGDMSLVGPRPAVEKYATSEKEKRVLDLRPGITDWASIWDSHEEAVLEGSSDPEKAYEELIHPTKIDLQLLYLENHSFVTDVKILFHTVAKLIDDEWYPRELKPYGKIRTYKALNETQTVAQGDFPDGQIQTTPPIRVSPRFRSGALESQSGNEI